MPTALGSEEISRPVLSDLGEGLYSLGEITINAREHSIRFPALVNMNEGLIEYALVHESGKTHESLLRTHIAPLEIQTALLLASPSAPSDRPRSLTISLRVPGAKKDTTPVQIEDWMMNLEQKLPLSRGPWHHIGSRTIEGVFLAQRDGSIIAVMKDPDAIVGNPRKDSVRDDLWEVRREIVPKPSTVVEVVFKFTAPPPPSTTP